MSNQEARRNVLKKLLMAAVTGAAIGAPLKALAQSSGGDLTRYVTMVRLQQDAIKINNIKKSETDPSIKAHISSRLDRKIDQVLTFAMNNFTADDYKSPEAYRACKDLFNGQFASVDTMSVEGLQQLLDVIVPVAVARHLLARERVTFNPHHVKSWNRFSDRYQDVILAA